ncbi:MAG TPA: hypothetical protein ENL04_02330 [Sulfuricurvum sp.]|nr:hypothetical protein [Sulfuricurvum sp.]
MIVQEQRVLPAMPQETSDGGAPFSNGRNDDNFMAIESHVINGVIEREDFAEPMSLEEFEWLKQNEEDVRTFAEAVIIKKTLMKHGLYRYESADRVTVSVEKAKRMARGTGDILFSALFDDARYAAIRNGAGHSDFEAPWQMIARAIETHPRIAKADRMTPDDISQLRRTLNGKGA